MHLFDKKQFSVLSKQSWSTCRIADPVLGTGHLAEGRKNHVSWPSEVQSQKMVAKDATLLDG